MFLIFRRCIALLLFSALFLADAPPARASIGYVSDSKAAGVIAGVVAAGVVIGLVIYYAVHHGHTVEGCAISGSQGLQLQTDDRVYLLRGEVSSVRAGERVRLGGTKKRQGGEWEFAVEKIRKDYGACPVAIQRP